MNYLKRNSIVLSMAAMVLAVFVSCEKEDSPESPEIEKPGTVAVGNVSVSAFTASVSGTFNGVSKVDLALGKSGILYCLKSDNAESIFKSWKDGNDNPDCLVYQNGKVNSNSYNGTLANLYPDTEYSFCLFMKNSDNTLREISPVSTFRTLDIKLECKNVRADTIRLFSAIIKGNLSVDSRDAEYCYTGFMLSDKADAVIGDNSVTYYTSENGIVNHRYIVQELNPETEYYYRAFVHYMTPDGKDHYQYGQVSRFSTGSMDDWKVDLGLPSGIQWSRCELGRQDFESAYEYFMTSPYRTCWGSLRRTFWNANNSNKEDYEYWYAANGNYIDIGSDIAGTQYDIAHVKLGGKWRLPTKEDVEELISCCSVNIQRVSYDYSYADGRGGMSYYASAAIIRAENGKYIKERGYPGFWTATMSEDGEHPYYAMAIRDGDIDCIRLNNDIPRDYSLDIRPVWDPNM